MQSPLRYITVVIWCLLLSATLPERHSFANTATGLRRSVNREVVNCYFGALRKDGRIMVNMVPGAAGKLYQLTSAVTVTLNGASVGQPYLVNGMPIALILDRQKTVGEIQIRQARGK
jgi:hypothetical protein